MVVGCRVTPSLISLAVSVDVKHHVYCLGCVDAGREHKNHRRWSAVRVTVVYVAVIIDRWLVQKGQGGACSGQQ